MKTKYLLFILALLASFVAKSQTYTFECVCDYVAPPNCDICNTQIQSRLFNGLLIRKNGTPHKWIDAPYIVKRQGVFANIQEIVYPNPESISISYQATPYDSIQQFLDSIQCYCSGNAAAFIAGPGITISGDTISAIDTSATNEIQYIDTLVIVGTQLRASLFKDARPFSAVNLPTYDGSETKVTAGTGISVSGTGTTASPYVVTNTGDLSNTNELQTLSWSSPNLSISSGNSVTLPVLPSGTTHQTLRHDGSSWVATSALLNDDTNIGVGGSPIGGFRAYINGAARIDGTGVFRGAGDPISSTTGPSVRLWNTTATTGQTWRMSSMNTGEWELNSDNSTTVLRATTAGDMYALYRLRIGSVSTITPTTIIGRDANGWVGTVSVGSGLTLSAGTLSASGGGTGTVTSVAATAPASGFTITGSPITTSGTLAFSLNNDLLGLENLSTTGIAVRTAANTWATRSLVAGSGISITNADGTAGNITISATGGGGGTLTGANNGTTLSGTTVQQGGSLIQNTTIDQGAFYFSYLNGRRAFNRYNSNTFVNANVTASMDVSGFGSNPQFVASPTEDAILHLRGTSVNAGTYYPNSLFFGVYPTAANGTWIQSRSESSYTTSYLLVLQPLGGKFAVNRSGTPPPAYATINGGGIAGTGASGEVLMIENPEGGNGYAEIGFATTNTTTASNTYNAGVGYTSGDNAQRLYNLSTASGASVRIGVGGRTSDKVIITGDNTIGRLGAGFSTTTGLHSTLQSAGSLAVAVTETTGALTLTENHQTAIFTGSANQTFTLPTASTCVGRVYRIGHAGTGGTVTLSASVTSGNGTFNTVTAGQWATIIATSGGWKGFKVASL